MENQMKNGTRKKILIKKLIPQKHMENEIDEWHRESLKLLQQNMISHPVSKSNSNSKNKNRRARVNRSLKKHHIRVLDRVKEVAIKERKIN